MRISHALRAGYREFKAILGTPVFTGPAPNPYAEQWRLWDEITNGWAAVRAGLGAFWGGLRQWGGTAYADLAAAAAANPHAGRGLRLICDNGAAVPVIAYQKNRSDSGGDEDEAAPESEALRAIERSGWERLWSPYVWGLYCGGEAFFLRLAPDTGPNAGRARRIVPLRNENLVEIKRDEAGEPTVYVFRKPGSSRFGSARSGGTVEHRAEDVLHVRLFNPADPDRGLPILVSARRALTLVEEADAWNRGIARGGGRVPGYLKPTTLPPGETYSADQVKTAQEATDRAFAERKAVNLPMILSGAFDYVEGSVSPKDADWLKGRTVAMREIAAVLGVPATLLADEKAGSLTDAGVDSEVAALFKLTIQPLVTRLLAELTEWLCDDGERLDADWDQVPALQEDMDAKFARYSNPAAPLTRRERRVALGYDPEPSPEMADDEKPAPPVPNDEDDPVIKSLRDLPETEFTGLLRLVA